MKIKVKYFDDEMTKIGKIEQGDWIDLRSEVNKKYKKGDYFLIPLGVAMELPPGMEAHVVPRSSTFKKYGVIQTNHMGVIDNTYCGDDDKWFMPCYALEDGFIHKDDGICQFRITPTMDMYLDEEGNSVELEEVEVLGNENRGGYGSTDINKYRWSMQFVHDNMKPETIECEGENEEDAFIKYMYGMLEEDYSYEELKEMGEKDGEFNIDNLGWEFEYRVGDFEKIR